MMVPIKLPRPRLSAFIAHVETKPEITGTSLGSPAWGREGSVPIGSSKEDGWCL